MKKMKKYLLQSKKLFILYLLLALATYMCVAGIYELYSMITEVINQMNLNSAYIVVIYSICILTALLFLLIISAIVKRSALNNIACKLREDVFYKVYGMTMNTFSKEESAYYTSMLVNDVTILEDSFFSNVFELIGDCIQLFVMLFSITLIGWKYTVIVCGFAVLSVIQPFVMKKKLAIRGAKVSEELKCYTSKTKEYIFSFESIKSLKKQEKFRGLFGLQVAELEKANHKLWSSKLINSLLVLVAVYTLKVGSQLLFAYTAIEGVISVAIVSLLFGLANNVGNPIASILSYIEPINSTKGIREKLLSFLDDNALDEEAKEDSIEEIQKISLNNVNYSYNKEKKVLDGLTISFDAGGKYALVGESGCGKSTILKLIMGYYQGYEGEILFDNVEMSHVSLETVRKNISYVTQKTYLFDGTLRENITLASAEASENEINDVIQKVQLKELIEKLPKGLDEIVSKTSANFSGGEKQRVALARALLRKNNTILIDEGVSALDNLLAIAIEKELLNSEKRVISVMHRFNDTIRLYDCIFYLENGRVAEAGTYDELMNMNGKFSEMLRKQGGLTNE